MYYRGERKSSGAYSKLLCGRRPFAKAEIKGSPKYPELLGMVEFFATPAGVVVSAEVSGLPYNKDDVCEPQIYGFHIHRAGRCTGTSESPYSDAGEHFDIDGCPHPAHSGDMPPLFGNHGYAWSAHLTDRFSPEDIMGRAVIIHAQRDDLHTDPSGDSGARIGCGVIVSA